MFAYNNVVRNTLIFVSLWMCKHLMCENVTPKIKINSYYRNFI